MRPRRLRHHDGTVPRPHRRQPDYARRTAGRHRNRRRHDIPHRTATHEAHMTTAQPTFAGVKQAAERLRPRIPTTPLYRSETLSRALDADVWLKLETATPIASFKLRGALNHLLVAQSEAPITSAVTSSTGNHGQGVAYAARLLGV